MLKCIKRGKWSTIIFRTRGYFFACQRTGALMWVTTCKKMSHQDSLLVCWAWEPRKNDYATTMADLSISCSSKVAPSLGRCVDDDAHLVDSVRLRLRAPLESATSWAGHLVLIVKWRFHPKVWWTQIKYGSPFPKLKYGSPFPKLTFYLVLFSENLHSNFMNISIIHVVKFLKTELLCDPPPLFTFGFPSP